MCPLAAAMQDNRWRQVNLWCDNWMTAEQVAAAHIGPVLAELEHIGMINSWWLVRKGPQWRLRYLPTAGMGADAATAVAHTMHNLTLDGAILWWTTAIYEPETRAFGGAAAMDIAHRLFHADSRHLLGRLRSGGPDHRRELGLLLGSLLLRVAGQDWYEQGDIWANVAAHRTSGPLQRIHRNTEAVYRLITANPHDPPAGAPAAWLAAYQHAGRALANLAQEGALTRGLRAILAHHILFAWNRAGIPSPQQASLAATASYLVFHQDQKTTPSATRVTHEPTTLGSGR